MSEQYLTCETKWYLPKDYHGLCVRLSRDEIKKQFKKDFPFLFSIFERHEKMAQQQGVCV